MPQHGQPDSPHRLESNGHACSGLIELDGDFGYVDGAFLTEGRELGQRLVFVAVPTPKRWSAAPRKEPTRSLAEPGMLRVVPFEAI
jgi:hypothetical protein